MGAHTWSADWFPGHEPVTCFFLLSGYVLSLSKKQVCSSIIFVCRYIRLMGPTFFAIFLQWSWSWIILSPKETMTILYESPIVFTLQTGSAKFGHNSSLWTIAYEVYGTVVVFITRQLCKRYGLRVFLPISAALYCSEYKDFNAIVLGVFLVEAKLAVKPKIGFIVLTIISFCIVIASHVWDFQNFGTKHVCTPLAAAGFLIVLSIVCTLLVDEPIMRFSNSFRTIASAKVAPESPAKDPKSFEKYGHNGMTM